MEIKSEQPLSYSAKTPKSANTAFGTQVSEQAHQKKNEAVQDRTPFGMQVSPQAQAKKADSVQDSAAVTAKKQLNQSILQASMEVSLSAGNNPAALLFKTALEGVNKALAGELGTNAIQKSYASGLDVSPQATADRIVQLSTAFFGQYQAKHPEQSTEDALHSFTTLIRGGIDKGFKEARGILEGLNVLKEGNISSNIDATYELVQKGLNAFVENYKKPATSESDTPA